MQIVTFCGTRIYSTWNCSLRVFCCLGNNEPCKLRLWERSSVVVVVVEFFLVCFGFYLKILHTGLGLFLQWLFGSLSKMFQTPVSHVMGRPRQRTIAGSEGK